jgi:hypothetical protein
MKKLINKIVVIIVFPTFVICQEKSMAIFDDLGVIHHNKSMAEFPNTNIMYIMKNNPCYGFIFKENGDIWYRDYCHHDYIDISKFGTYTINHDTININSTYINIAERIHRVSIKKIEQTPIENDTFYINTFNEKGEMEGLAFSIMYFELPSRPWKRKKEKWVDLRKPSNWADFPEEIYVKQIWVSGQKNKNQ